jgi:hypothetical protein
MKEPAIQCRASVCSRGGARTRLSAVVALLALGVILLLGSARASALVRRGHVFAGTFKGSGTQSFTTPGGVAVNEASGEVYVSDPVHDRVERFRPAAGGYEFAGEFKVAGAGAIAIDNSSSEADPSRGDVYVAGAGSAKEVKEAEEEGREPERDYLYKFKVTASGEELIFKKRKYTFKIKVEGSEEEFPEEVELERISGLAVDASGNLWVYWSEGGNIFGFSNAEQNKLLPSLTKEAVLELPALSVGCLAEPGFAVGAGDEVFYLAHERENGLGSCPSELEKSSTTVVSKLAVSEEATKRSLDNQDSTGVALDPASGEVYLDNVDSVAVFGPEGSFVQRFGSEDLKKGGAVAVDSARGIVYVGEPGKVAIFTREEAGAPTVDSFSAENLTPSSERVNAQIDPDGAKTTFRVQYGTVSCTEHESSCTNTPEQEVGDGFGDVAVKATLEGLESNTPYFYRVIANNEHGTAVSSQSSFLTMLPSSERVMLDHRQWELVSPVERHGATPEPISEEGAPIQAAADGNSLAWTAGAPFTREAEGNRAPEPVQAISTRGSEEWSSKNITTPRNKGEGVSTEEPAEYRFFSSDLSFAVVQPQFLGSEEPLENPPLAPGAREKDIYQRNDDTGEFEALVTAANDATGEPWAHELRFQGATADAGHIVFKSDVPLVSGAGEKGLYEWEAGAPLKFLSVLPGSKHKPASEPGLGFKGFDVRGAISQEGSRVFWTNEEEKGPLYMSNTGTGETIQINAAEKGVREAHAEEIEDNLDEVYFQAASTDGSKVFFTDSWPLTSESTLEPTVQQPEPRSADLYEFDVETGKLTDLTVPRNAGEQAEVVGTIPGISEDGSYVYFVANGVMAPGAEHGNCKRESVRNEQLEQRLEGKCNLYVSGPDPEHPGLRQTRLIARVSEEDSADWSAGAWPGPANLGGLTSRVSGNGRYLAFMSDQKLTGYDNLDANLEAKGPHGKGLALDQEVFLYDASTGRLVCTSCNPEGHAPHGVFDTQDAGEGLFLTVDRPDLWSGRWLAGSIPGWTRYGETVLADHQSRYLSNEGRLFFNSADALVPQVQARTREENVEGKTLQVGVENVYEYEPQGIGSCQQAGGCVALVSSGESDHESAFLDASENGNDVFFLTAAKLVAQETESGYDIYDARSCGTAETGACLPERKMPPPGCTGEECRPPVSGQPSFELPPSFVSAPSGSGEHPAGPSNMKKTAPKPLTRAQELGKALTACHKLKQKKRRAACERKARKAFGAKARPRKATARRTTASRRKGR